MLTDDAVDGVTVVRGERELFARAAHLFENAREVSCAAADLHTWAAARPLARRSRPTSVRKIYRPGVLLDASAARELHEHAGNGVAIRMSTQDINETIILDRRTVILAGHVVDGVRRYSVLSEPELVTGVVSLFEAAWRGTRELASFDADMAQVRLLAPRILDLLATGMKDEAAARELGLGLRTYRRRVAELMQALGANSRFQAGARARQFGLL